MAEGQPQLSDLGLPWKGHLKHHLVGEYGGFA